MSESPEGSGRTIVDMVNSRFLGTREDARSVNGVAHVWEHAWDDGEPVETRILARDPEGADSWLLADSAQPAAAMIARGVVRGEDLAPFYWVSRRAVLNDDGSQAWPADDPSDAAKHAVTALAQLEAEPLTTEQKDQRVRFRPGDRVIVQGSQPGV
jgi:hypothetical protein